MGCLQLITIIGSNFLRLPSIISLLIFSSTDTTFFST
jgi:hypothetical protein